MPSRLAVLATATAGVVVAPAAWAQKLEGASKTGGHAMVNE